jgi:1-deoxy-D-xylulose-5-phosphate reductoisomerase
MKKKISILGSTGSIGLTALKIIKKKKNLFTINTLVAKNNYKEICKQVKDFQPNNFVVLNIKNYINLKKKFKKTKTKFFNNYKNLIKKKNDITIAAIPGIAGLEPTIQFTKNSKKILLANKESIICGWNIINKIAKKNNTQIVPLDSEHFSINKLTENYKDKEIEKIYITASGGPFLNLPQKQFSKIKPKAAIKHPKWSMGKKISVDSATLMNKILELLEAQKIFPYQSNKYEIIIHPQSLVHAIVKFKNGITKLLYHEPDMTIPIANAIFNFDINMNSLYKKKFNKIGKIEFFKVNKNTFPSIKLIPKLNQYISTPIVINAANEILVDQFLKKRIRFNSIFKYLSKLLKHKKYKKYAIQRPINLDKIYLIDNWSRKATLEIIDKKKL